MPKSKEVKEVQVGLFDPDEFTDFNAGGINLESGFDELNLAEFPICSLYRPRGKDVKTLEFVDNIVDRKTGKEIERRVTVTGSDKYGLPNSYDDEILLALLQLTANSGNPKKVYFTKRRILDILKWSNGGKATKRVEEGLNRWLGTTIHYKNSWRNKSDETWETKGFHLIENVFLHDQKAENSLKQSYIIWNDTILNSMKSGNLKALNLIAFRNLRSPTAKRLFRYLDKRFYQKHKLSYDLHHFAANKIGLQIEGLSVSVIKRNLMRGIEELEDAGFLKPLSVEERFQKCYSKKWKINFVSGVSKNKANTDSTQPIELELLDESIGMLTTFQVSAKTAKKLIDEYGAERIKQQIKYYEFIISKHIESNRGGTPPGPGFLVDSIKNNYSPPNGFKTEIEKAKVLQHREFLKQQSLEQNERYEQEIEKQRLEIESKRREEVDSYLQSLSESERDFFIQNAYERAYASGDRFVYDTGLLADAERDNAIYEAVIRVKN